MKKTTSQIRHEKLIDFLNQFHQYQTVGKPRCKKVNETIGSGELKSLDTNIINTGVVVLTDYLNLRGGFRKIVSFFYAFSLDFLKTL